MPDYEPGACNIGDAERRRRSALGAAGSVATLLFVTAVLVAGPDVMLVVVALPLFLATLGHLQARAGFCVYFATRGVYDVSPDGDDRREVTDAAARTTDRKRAARTAVVSAGVALVGAGCVYAVGLLVP